MRPWTSLLPSLVAAGCSASAHVPPGPETSVNAAVHPVVTAQADAIAVPPLALTPPRPPTRVVIISEDGLAADALDPELAPTPDEGAAQAAAVAAFESATGATVELDDLGAITSG